MVNIPCAVHGCPSRSKLNKDLSWHRIPSDHRLDSWLNFCQRPDLRDKTKKQLYNYYVCSRHFEPWMFKNRGDTQSLYNSAIPSLNRSALGDEAGMPGMASGAVVKTENEGSTFEAYSTEVPIVTVKQEIEDFSVDEEDVEEQLKRKKKETDPLAVQAKKIKVDEPKNPVPYPMPKPKVLTVDINLDKEIFPVDFMKSVLNSQNEILAVVKSQVLLENPDRELLTFLRLLGAKLSRLSQEDRKEMQDAIINLLYKH